MVGRKTRAGTKKRIRWNEGQGDGVGSIGSEDLKLSREASEEARRASNATGILVPEGAKGSSGAAGRSSGGGKRTKNDDRV